ncbi:hypothetical protein JCM10207_007467 [Rhodosporidiobolus poonsookiae]
MIIQRPCNFSLPPNAPSRTLAFAGRELTDVQVQPFRFGKVLLTDDPETACADQQVVKNAGSIQLVYKLIKDVQIVKGAKAKFTKETDPAKAIDERSKKATLSHMTTFDEPVEAREVTRASFDIEDKSYATVTFRYRSRQLLQLQGHIPDSPEPSPQPSPSPAPASPADNPSPPPAASASPAPAAPNPPAAASQARRAAIEAELEALRREKRIAQLERELDELQQADEAAASQSQTGKRPAEDAPRLSAAEIKKVKLEKVEELERQKRRDKRRGKEAEVLDLCNSDSE